MNVGSVSGTGAVWQAPKSDGAQLTNNSTESAGTLAEDSVQLSDEGRAMALGDPDWPDPPAEDQKG